MSGSNALFRNRRTLSAISIGALILTLCAGFWPFQAHPANRVVWLPGQKGIELGRGGIVLSSQDFDWPGSMGAGFGFEIWLTPANNPGVSDLVNFNSPNAPQKLRIFKWRESTLLLYKDLPPQHREIDIDHAFAPGAPLLITITGTSQGTTVYLNGAPKGHSSYLALSHADFSGQMVIGTSALTNTPWSGQLRGIAFYARELTPAQVFSHWHAWNSGLFPEGDAGDVPLAIYNFTGGPGAVIQDQLGNGPSLYIPSAYFIPHKPFLELPWRDFRNNWRGFQDIAINIAGFAVVGFFLCAWLGSYLSPPASLRSQSGRRRQVLIAVILSAALSLFIEAGQFYLPARTSSLMDVMMNTVGALGGAWGWRLAGRAMAAHARFGKPRQN